MSSNANRKYDWVEYENGKVLGKIDQCISESPIPLDELLNRCKNFVLFR